MKANDLIYRLQQPGVQKVLAALVFLFWIGFFYQKIDILNKLPHRPTGEHTWAQTDRASMALTYYMDDAPFLLPRCHQAPPGSEGITAGEFPLIPYTVSKMYSAWGFREVYHRSLVLGITLIGFIFSFLLALRYIRQPLWAAFAASAWIASPNIIYYSFSFLPDAPSLALITIALFYLLRGKSEVRPRDYVLFAFFFSLAALIKLSAVFPVCSVTAALYICERRKRFPGWKHKLALAAAVAIPLLLTFLWVLYARHIVRKYGIFTFLLEPLPPTSWADFRHGVRVWRQLLEYYYSTGFQYFLVIASGLALIWIRRSNRFLLLSAVFIYITYAGFFILMFQKSPVHGYYWVPFQIAVFFHVAWITDLITKITMPAWTRYVLWAGAMVFLNYNMIHITKNMKGRWGKNEEYYTRYYDLEPYLDSIGVGYEDRVFSYADPTFNVTLYLMNRKGVVEGPGEEIFKLKAGLQTNEYAVLNDTSIVENPELKPYFHRRLGEHNNIVIYQLHADERTDSRPDR